MKKKTLGRAAGPAIKLRVATPGEIGLVQYMFEKVGMMSFGSALTSAFFVAEAEGFEVMGPLLAFQVYWGHAPEGVCGLATVTAWSVPGGAQRWAGMFPGRSPVVEAGRQLLESLPASVSRLEVLPRAEDRVSRAGLERTGLKLEGVVRNWYPWKGKMVNAAMYSWVRDEKAGA